MKTHLLTQLQLNPTASIIRLPTVIRNTCIVYARASHRYNASSYNITVAQCVRYTYIIKLSSPPKERTKFTQNIKKLFKPKHI